jgi:putative heme-binding domain-containing protein
VIVWQNLHPLLEDRAGEFLDTVAARKLGGSPNVARLMPRVVERILARGRTNPELALSLFTMLTEGQEPAPEAARRCLAVLAGKVHSGETGAAEAEALRRRMGPVLRRLLARSSADPLHLDAAVLAASLRDPAGLEVARKAFASPGQPEATRLKALEALVAARDPAVLDAVAPVLADHKGLSVTFRGEVLGALGKLDDPEVATLVLADYPRMEPELRPQALELLTQRAAWSKQLLGAIARKEVSASDLNVNQIRKLLTSHDPDLVRQARALWGTVREGRNPEREKVVAQMGALLRRRRGDPFAGAQVFRKLCGQCHKIYGEGQDVGPDITVNGRGSFEQLLSNVFDPSLVIGTAYQATTVTTARGRSLTGLLVEDSPSRVVLKTEGGKLETVPRDEVEEMTVSKVSLMPEGIEQQLKPQEIVDLFAFLTIDKPPGDPTARKLPGTPR